MLRYRSNPTLVANPAPEVPKAADHVRAGEPLNEGDMAGRSGDATPAAVDAIERKRAQARERKRRQRARQRLGVIVVPICVFEDDLDAALQRGEINEEEIDNRELLSTFLEEDLGYRLRKGGFNLIRADIAV
jgi:hypothetical protein